MPKTRKDSPSEVITFRLDYKIFKQLSRLALNERVSVHEYVRNIVFEFLAQEPVREEIKDTKIQLIDLNKDMLEKQDINYQMLKQVFSMVKVIKERDENDDYYQQEYD